MSLRKAINAHCFACSYDPKDRGHKRQQVTACAAESCALHVFRPISGQPLSQALLDHWGLKKQPSGGQK